MKIQVATAFAAFMMTSLTAADSIEIAKSVWPYVERHELAGAVTLVVSKDKFLSLETVGYADIAAKRKMRPDTLFWIASMSKPITAVAVMMLVDEGRIQLDDPVSKYLPGFAPRIMSVSDGSSARIGEPGHSITVRNLLAHTSGLPFQSPIEKPTFDVYPLATRVQSYSLGLLEGEPGSDYRYSNAGINTAGRIVEVVSGKRFEDFLNERLFEPLEMIDTVFWPTEAQAQRLAKSYKVNAQSGDLEETPITQLQYPLTDHVGRYPIPAGGLFSTASDLGKFCQMLLNGGTLAGRRYLSEQAIREMTRNQLDPATQPQAAEQMKAGLGYGLGWQTNVSGAYEHGGAYSTHMSIDPNHRLATIWLVQHAASVDKIRVAFQGAVRRQFISSGAARARLPSLRSASTND